MGAARRSASSPRPCGERVGGEGLLSTSRGAERAPHRTAARPTSPEGRGENHYASSIRLRHPRRRGRRHEGRRFQHRRAERGRDGHAERNQDPCACDRHEGDLDIALGGELFDHGAIGDIARDRREIDRADHAGP